LANAERGQWSSKIGFIFAAAGSAIGLGNIWKFPGKVGAGGGGAYILIYIAIVFTIGISVMLAELTVGRKTQLNTIGALRKLNRKWTVVGYLGIICGFIVLSYYSIIGGQVLKYMFFYLGGARFSQSPAAYFESFVSGTWQPILWGLLFLVVTGFIVLRGIAGGIEQANKILMPALIILLIVIMIHSLSMPGADKGVRFLTNIDFTALKPADFLSALGQALFSLSIGLGTTCTYGSYLSRDENLSSSSVIVCVFDTLIAFIAAFTIIPAVFSTGTELSTGGGFAFIALPQVFSQMSGGTFYGFIFYLLLSFAALTSSIALLEGTVAYLSEETGMSRLKAVFLSCGGMATVGILYSLSLGAFPLKGIWYTVRDGVVFPSLGHMLELITDNLLIPIGSLGFCIFVGWIWGVKNAVSEISQDGKFKFALSHLWVLMVKYIAPAAITLIFILGILGVVEY